MHPQYLLQRLTSLPQCGWHDLIEHHSTGGPADPETEAVVAMLFAAVAIGVLASMASGVVLIAFTRRIRTMFYAIPSLNLALYSIYLLMRSYPGGREAQLHGRGLVWTLLGLLLLLLLSLVCAAILGLMRWGVRFARSAIGRGEPASLTPAHPRD